MDFLQFTHFLFLPDELNIFARWSGRVMN
jgi:hypothetical protein